MNNGDLISREAVLQQIGEKLNVLRGCNDFKEAWGMRYAMGMIQNAPAVDVVEAVRCRDCKHWKPSGSKAGNSFSDMEYIGGCEFTNYCRRESDYCSYGERKE